MDEQTQNALEGFPLELRIQIGEAIAGAPAERRDEIAYEILASHRGYATEEQILAIDLKELDRLCTFPMSDETDWQLMRDQLAFLQSAVRAGIPWPKIVLGTIHHFGSILKSPFHPVSEPLDIPPYQPPSYDVSRHTPAMWRQEAEKGWIQHRNDLFHQIQNQFNQLIASGQLKVFDRLRVNRKPNHKESILDEDAALAMAAKNYFLGVGWADLADEFPPKRGYFGTPVEKARQKKRRANQIRMRVASLLKRIEKSHQGQRSVRRFTSRGRAEASPDRRPRTRKVMRSSMHEF